MQNNGNERVGFILISLSLKKPSFIDGC